MERLADLKGFDSPEVFWGRFFSFDIPKGLFWNLLESQFSSHSVKNAAFSDSLIRKSNWLVVSKIFHFHPYLGKIPILTNIVQSG